MKKPQRKIKWLATQNQRLKAYQRTPELLAEDLLVIFSKKVKPEDMGTHNHMLGKLFDYCPNFEQMLINVAKSITKTAKEGRGDMKSDT